MRGLIVLLGILAVAAIPCYFLWLIWEQAATALP